MKIPKLIQKDKTRNIYLKYSLLILILLSTYLIISPYITVFSFFKTLESGNTSKLMNYIDKNPLKANLSKEIRPMIYRELSSNPKYQIKTGLDKFVINVLAETLTKITINSILTPNGISLLMKTGEIGLRRTDNNALHIYNKKTEIRKFNNKKISYRYVTSSDFVVNIYTSNNKYILGSNWKRYSLNRWLLNEIKFPNQSLSNIIQSNK